MTYSDDYASPQAFQGDPTGDIFTEPDIVAHSPVTTVRVVETQSGFQVVVKEVDSRLSLSVKRRIGTPPSSHVLLTGDESLKLSRILAQKKGARDYDMTGEYKIAAAGTPAAVPEVTDWDEFKQPLRKRRGAAAGDTARPKSIFSNKFLIGGGVAVLALCGAVLALAFVGITHLLNPDSEGTGTKLVAANPMEAEQVDKFVRNYVANMLDFSPRTYRASQIQAMSVMKPELMERYWNETSFPISKKQLRSLPGDQTVMINKVVQEPTSTVTTDVDLFADLVTAEGKSSHPVHLKLDIGLNDEGKLVVLEQKDISNKGKK